MTIHIAIPFGPTFDLPDLGDIERGVADTLKDPIGAVTRDVTAALHTIVDPIAADVSTIAGDVGATVTNALGTIGSGFEGALNAFVKDITTTESLALDAFQNVEIQVRQAIDSEEGKVAVRAAFTLAYAGGALAASALSFIPLTANVGAHLGGRMIHTLVAPFSRGVYEAPIELSLQSIFPNKTINPRIVLKGMEEGAFGEDELTQALVEDGITDHGARLAVKLARHLTLQAESKPDVELAKMYHTLLVTNDIETQKDTIRATLTDLKDQLKTLRAEKRKAELAAASKP